MSRLPWGQATLGGDGVGAKGGKALAQRSFRGDWVRQMATWKPRHTSFGMN